jgi:hypothetical protein
MPSEPGKYRVNPMFAHRHLSQVDPQVRDAVLGNVGTMISFRVGPADAEILEKEFAPEVRALDLVGLPNYHVYLKLMIDGRVSRPFSAETITTRTLSQPLS